MKYKVKNRRLKVDDEEGDGYVDLCENTYVSRVLKNLLTGEETVDITIEYPNDEYRVSLPRVKICTSIISELSKYGLGCPNSSRNSEFLQYILFDTATHVQKEYFHDALGFVKLADGSDAFLHYRPIGIADAQLNSSIHIDQDIKPCGTLHGWKSIIRQLVYGRGHMELALAIGAVAPIAHLLLEAKMISEIPMFSLVGQSTSGKTTSLILASSIWYSSNLIADFNCTSNAFVAQMAGARGLPMLVDESSAVANWDFTGLLYNLPKGKSKLRCNGDGSLQKRQEFSGCIVYTGESSLFEQAANNRGLEARLLEFMLPWTEDAKHAESLTKALSKNYGVAAEPLMSWILENQETVVSWYRGYSSEFYNICKDFLTDSVLKRLAKMASIIITAADVLNTALGLKLYLKNITTTLISIIEEKCEEFNKSADVWYDKLKKFTLDNPKKFPAENETLKVYQIWGYRCWYINGEIVWIRDDIFENFIKEITSVDLKIVKKQLAEKGFIKYEDRHYMFKKKINSTNVMCYGLLLAPEKQNNCKRNIKRNLLN